MVKGNQTVVPASAGHDEGGRQNHEFGPSIRDTVQQG